MNIVKLKKQETRMIHSQDKIEKKVKDSSK